MRDAAARAFFSDGLAGTSEHDPDGLSLQFTSTEETLDVDVAPIDLISGLERIPSRRNLFSTVWPDREGGGGGGTRRRR